MVHVKKTGIIGALILAISTAWAAPTALTYQGRILKSDGTPLTYNNVSFIFQITNPAGSCVIYQEQVTGYDMTNSAGVFDMPIGSGSISFPLGGGATVVDTFNNLPTAPFTCGSCSGYTCTNSASTYSPVSTDGRLLRVKFYDGASWQSITPDSVIRSVPFAGFSGSAEKLGTNVASDFLLKAGLPTCGANTFLAWNGSALSCLPVAGSSGGTVTNVSSANADISVATGTSTPVLTLNSGTTANQIVKLDAAAKLPAVNGSQLTNISAANITGVVPVANGGTNSSTVLNNNRIMITSGGAITEAPVMTNGQILIGSTGAAPQVANLTAGSGVTVTNSAGGISIGLSAEVGGVNGLATTGYVQRTGAGAYSTTAGSAAASNNTLVLRDGSGVSNFYGVGVSGATSGIVTFQSPATVTSYSLKLPAAQGGANQMLTNDGAGNLAWSNLSSLGVASVAVTSPITNSGTASAPNIGIQVANTTQSGYLSSADWNTFNGKQSTALTSANILVGNVSNAATAVAPSGDVSMTNAGAFTVTGLRGKTVSATVPSAAGQVLRYDGTSAYVPAFLGLADIKASITPFGGAFASAACSASQTLYWQSSTDTFQCQSVAIGDAQITYASKTANTFLAAPSGSAGAPTFRGIASADLPATGVDGAYVNGGNSFGSAATLGTNDLNSVGIKTNNATRMTVDTSGNVGIGTTSPGAILDVQPSGTSGDFQVVSSGNANQVTLQTSAGSSGFIRFASRIVPDTNGTISLGTSGNYWNNFYTTNAYVSGNVGIGTTSPQMALDIVGSGQATAYGVGGASVAGISISDSVADPSTRNWRIVNAHDGPGMLEFEVSSASGGNPLNSVMAITSAGRVGIGNTSPESLLHVANLTGTGTTLTVGNPTVAGNNSNTGTLKLYGENAGVVYSGTITQGSTNMFIGTSGSVLFTSDVRAISGKTFIAEDSTTTKTVTLSHNGTNGVLAVNSGNISLTGGNVGIGLTGPGYKLDVNGDVNIASANVLRFGGTQVCATAGCTATSDRRLKENIVPLQDSLVNILKLQGVSYDWKDKNKYGKGQQVGLIAQDLEKVYPQVVVTDPKSGLKSVAYDHLIAPMIEAFKELNNRLKELLKASEGHSEAIATLKANNTSKDREIASVRSEANSAKVEAAQAKAEAQEAKARAEKAEKENTAIKAYLCNKDPSAAICH